MTVQATSPIHTYVYSGPGTYNFDFRVFQETDVVVTHYDDTTNEPTILTRGVDYSVTLNAGGVGGKVDTTYSVTSGRLELKRQLERTQIEDLENADDFDQDALERGLDRLVMMLQEMDTVIAGATITTNWKGDWVTGTKYLLREIVAAPSGDWYVCVVAHTASADFSTDLGAGYWTIALKVSDIETMRDEVEADRAEVAANKSIVEADKAAVAADKATVATDKDEVHSDRLVVEAIAGDIPDISTSTPGQVLVVNDAKSGYDFSAGHPIGSLIMYIGSTIPDSYLNCDGSELSRTVYDKLFSVIGTEHGAGDGSTTYNLPDFRGYFPRAADEGTGNDPYSGDRVRGDGTVGGYLGSILDYRTGIAKVTALQTATGGSHVHSYSRSDPTNQNVDSGAYGVYNGSEITYNTAWGGSHAHNVNIGGDAETAPKSFYVRFLIRYK